MTSVEMVKNLCKERGISVHKLEMDLGFANGYIGQLKKGTMPNDRISKIADYFGVSVEYLSGGNDARYSDDVTHLFAKIRADKDLTEALQTYFALPRETRKLAVDLIKKLGGK